MRFSCFGHCFATWPFFFNGLGEPNSFGFGVYILSFSCGLWALRMHSKQQNSQWEIHEYIDLLNFVCLNAFIACSILYF